MKTRILAFVAMVAMAVVSPVRAADDAAAFIQKGLFEEEARQDLDGAAKDYQQAVEMIDKDRQLDATAIFRLGECWRKLGRTNDANVQYQRILREFPDQTNLTKLCSDYLSGAVLAETPTAQPNAAMREAQETYDGLKVKLTLAERELSVVTNLRSNGEFERYFSTVKPDAELAELFKKRSEAQAEMKAAAASGNGSEQPLVKEKEAKVEDAENQEHSRVSDLLWGMKTEVESLRKQAESLRNLLNQSGAQVTAATAASPAPSPEDEAVLQIKEMIHNSPDLINLPGSGGLTPLQDAAHTDNLSTAQLLLDNGAEVDGANPRLGDLQGRTPLRLAAEQGNLKMSQLLLSHGAKLDDSGALQEAVRHDYSNEVEFLLANKANPNSLDAQGSVPLVEAAAKGYRTMAELLVAHHADVNATNRDGQTALYAASLHGNGEVVDFLLAQGADPNLATKSGDEPLLEALLWRHMDIAKTLVNHKANPNAILSDGRSLLRDILDQEPGADHNRTRFLLEAGADPNLADSRGVTPLMRAVAENDLDMVQLLLDHHADVNKLDQTGHPALAYLGFAPGRMPGFRGQISVGGFGANRAHDDPVHQIRALLLQAGASEDYERTGKIFVAPLGSGSLGTEVFDEGTNNFNHFTLCAVIAATYSPGSIGAIEFPDFAHVVINRLKPGGAKEDIAVNLEEILKAGDPSRDLPLQGGDVVQIPQADHLVNMPWNRLPEEAQAGLVHCLAGVVDIVVKGQTNRFALSVPFAPGDFVRSTPDFAWEPLKRTVLELGEPQSEAPGNFLPQRVITAVTKPDARSVPVLHNAFLYRAIHAANVLQISSDLTRVKVIRGPNTMQFDLTDPPAHDLWLRDGDVVVIPEKAAVADSGN